MNFPKPAHTPRFPLFQVIMFKLNGRDIKKDEDTWSIRRPKANENDRGQSTDLVSDELYIRIAFALINTKVQCSL